MHNDNDGREDCEDDDDGAGDDGRFSTSLLLPPLSSVIMLVAVSTVEHVDAVEAPLPLLLLPLLAVDLILAASDSQIIVGVDVRWWSYKGMLCKYNGQDSQGKKEEHEMMI